MSRYPLSLAAIPASDYKAAQRPEIGVDSYIGRFSPFVPVHIATIRFTAAAVATMETTGNTIPAGFYLGCRAFGNGLQGDIAPNAALTPVAITVAATLAGSVSDSLVATFASPAWSLKSVNRYPKFTTRDFIPVTANNAALAVTTLGTLTSVAGGSAGSVVQIWAFPPATSYFLIECIEDKNGGPPPDQIVPIACGRNPQEHTAQGRAEVQELEITMPYKGYMEQLSRFQGAKGTFAIEVRKDDQAFTQVELYGGYIPAMNHPRGGENDTVVATFAAPFEQFFAGYAV